MQLVYDLVVVGGGPGGIGAVVEAKTLGLQNVLMIEKGDSHSQTIRKFYKDNKRVDKDYKGVEVELKGSINFKDGTKESTLNYFDALLDNEEIDVVFNSDVEKIKKEDDLFKVITSKSGYCAKNVIIAIGTMGKPNKPDYKIPPSIKNRVNFNLDKCSTDERVLVVGGGNSAVEYAIDLAQTNSVTLAYRKENFSRLNEINEKTIYEYASNKKLELKMACDIESLDSDNGLVKVNFKDDSSAIYERVIYAIGGSAPVDFLKACGVTFDENNKLEIDENFQTKTDGLYLAGDIAIKKGGSIAFALSHAYHIVSHSLSKG
ncbi:MAG TPA: cbb3-type cytochrome oxidase assembly protein CcoS [Sulfurimonas sp.]|nr:cbb3-type cytochrome oxidase assembly protein CcoS [Sulfurimonas sp.]